MTKNLQGFKIKEYTVGNMVLGIALDIGPRILKLAHADRPEENLFGILPGAGVDTPDGFWHIFGGHRLWTSPEASPRSYSPDNVPVKITDTGEAVQISSSPEVTNSIKKDIEIRADENGMAEVIHSLTNIGRWPIKVACWALSVMKTGGFAVIPVRSFATTGQLLPDRHLSLWPYTDFSDKRINMTNDYIFLRQDTATERPCKLGTMAKPTWTAYCVDGNIFIKRFSAVNGDYPDFGCSVEVYTNNAMLELETLSPLQELQPGATLRHSETWEIKELPERVKDPLSPSFDKEFFSCI